MRQKREIGSEFWNVPTSHPHSFFQGSIQWFLSGRSALQAIIQELPQNGTVALPSWCCDSMIKPFVDKGMKVCFYPVYYQNGLIQEINMKSDVLFLMDYFGYTAQIPDLSAYQGIIIRDVTHSIFSTDYSDADYYFGSLRKWCGLWTGGYAWTKNGHVLEVHDSGDYGYAALRKQAMQLKKLYINGDAHDNGEKAYLKIFDAAEKCLEKIEIVPAVERDIQLAGKLDIDFIRSRRRANAEVLRSAFPDWLICKDMKEHDCPLFVPLFIPDGHRDAMRKYLIQNDIYCPIHWSVSEYHKLESREQLLYENELSLVCDQRYTEEDMCRMVEKIQLF